MGFSDLLIHRNTLGSVLVLIFLHRAVQSPQVQEEEDLEGREDRKRTNQSVRWWWIIETINRKTCDLLIRRERKRKTKKREKRILIIKETPSPI
jgi:hypothetical protein